MYVFAPFILAKSGIIFSISPEKLYSKSRSYNTHTYCDPVKVPFLNQRA